MVTAQATTTEQSQICVSQHYRWHMMIEAEWEDLRRTNSPRDIFIQGWEEGGWDKRFQSSM